MLLRCDRGRHARREVIAHFFRSPALGSGHTCGNSVSMKVTVSIPDELLAGVELLAKQLRASRSEIYSRALGEFLGRHAPDCVTEQMNRVIASVGKEAVPFDRRVARGRSQRGEW